MKILIDMNLSPRWADFFKSQNIAAEHWSNLGDARATDKTLMDYASRHGYVILTHDLDFSAILAASGDSMPSVVQIRGGDMTIERIGTALVQSLRQLEAEIAAGALITFDVDQARLRILPLKLK